MKTTEVTKRVNKLKDVVMNLHRSAGQLDQMIQSIEAELHGRDEVDKEWLHIFVKSQTQYREEFYWEKLLQAIEKES